MISARTTCCSSPPLLRLRPVGDVASAVENVLAAYSVTTVAPHEYFDQTGWNASSVEEIRKQGVDPWFYTGAAVTDEDGLNCRSLSWLAWKFHAGSWTLWELDFNSLRAWQNAETYPGQNGARDADLPG